MRCEPFPFPGDLGVLKTYMLYVRYIFMEVGSLVVTLIMSYSSFSFPGYDKPMEGTWRIDTNFACFASNP